MLRVEIHRNFYPFYEKKADNRMIACRTIFRSLAKLIKKKIGCSDEINNFKKILSRVR